MSVPDGENVAQGVARGAALLIIARLATRLIDFAILIVLGRLLTPSDFGLVAIAMTVVQIVEALMEMPVALVLLRSSPDDKARLNTAFSIGLLRGIGLALLLSAFAWPLAQVYDDPRLVALICALSLAPAFRGMQSPRLVAFAQSFKFSREFLIEIVAKVAAFVTSVSVALMTDSYWAIALGTIIAPIIMFLMSYLLAPYRPHFSLSEWREFAGVLGWNTVTQSIAALNWQWDQLVLGKFTTRAQFGQFTMANTLAMLPSQVIVVQLLRTLLPAFAMFRTDKDKLATAYRFSSQSLLAISVPALVGLSLLALPVIRLALGPQWVDAAPMLMVLALACIPSMFIAALPPVAIILDRTSVNTRVAIAEFVVKAPLSLVAAMTYGIAGVLVVRVFALTSVAFYGMHQVRNLTGLSIASQLLVGWRVIAGALAMSAVLLWITPMSAAYEGAELIIWLFLAAGLGVTAYVATMIALWFAAGRPAGVEDKILGIAAKLFRRVLNRRAV